MTKRRRQSRLPLLAIGLAAAAAAIVAAALHWTQATPGGPTPTPGARAEGTGTSRGRPDAPVHIQEFSDFRCYYCGVFATQIEPAINAEFIKPGIARLTFRHFPVLGPLSEQAAEASECASAQGRFWPYHDALFARTLRRELRSRGDLDAAAREVGLDLSAFSRCLDDGRSRARVASDRAEGTRRGVTGTPTIFVGDQKIVGAQPIEVFRAAINAARPR